MVLYQKRDIRIFGEIDVEHRFKEMYVKQLSPYDCPINGSDFSIGNNLHNWEDTTLLNLAIFLGWEIGFASPECALALLCDLIEISGWHMLIKEYIKWREETYPKLKKVL